MKQCCIFVLIFFILNAAMAVPTIFKLSENSVKIVDIMDAFRNALNENSDMNSPNIDRTNLLYTYMHILFSEQNKKAPKNFKEKFLKMLTEDNIESLNGKHTIFGALSEGAEIL